MSLARTLNRFRASILQALAIHGLPFATKDELKELTGLPPGAVTAQV